LKSFKTEIYSSASPVTTITEGQSFYWVFYVILSYPPVWLCFPLSSVTALTPDILIKLAENLAENLRQQKKERFKQKQKMFDVNVQQWREQERKKAGALLLFYYCV
jgi:hypothetical protein